MRGACHMARHCKVLMATTFGAITYERSPFRSSVRGNLPSESELATLSLAAPFAARPSWRQQLCASSSDGLTLDGACSPTSRGLFHVSRAGAWSLRFASAKRPGSWLCGDSGRVRLSPTCQFSEWQVVTSPMGCATVPPEAAIWLRLKGSGSPFLAVVGGEVTLVSWSSVNASTSCGRWALGFSQPRHSEVLDEGNSRDCQLGMCGGPCGYGVPHVEVWLLSSSNYHFLLYYMLYMLKYVGDLVRVHLRWVGDLRQSASVGWDKNRQFGFNIRKLMLLAEAQLHAELNGCGPREPTVVVVMDLDVVVFPGWTHLLLSCIAGGANAADICFAEQPEHPHEVANGGVFVWRGHSTAAASLIHATIARHQNLEVFQRILPEGPTELDQVIVNKILHAVPRLAGDHPGARPLRWGIYNPVLARVGPQPSAPLTLKLQHVTFGTSLNEKMIYMKRVVMVVEHLRDLCGSMDARCQHNPDGVDCFRSQPEVIGPISSLCLASLEGDPHFGPPNECFKVYAPFRTTHRSTYTQRLRKSMTTVAGLHSELWSTDYGDEIMQLLSDTTRHSLDWSMIPDEVAQKAVDDGYHPSIAPIDAS